MSLHVERYHHSLFICDHRGHHAAKIVYHKWLRQWSISVNGITMPATLEPPLAGNNNRAFLNQIASALLLKKALP